MARVRWGIGASEVDDFDRSSQYTPYRGPEPKNGVYLWRVKVLKYAAGTSTKNPQLRVGLELVPREARGEEKYAGYFSMNFIPVNDKMMWKLVPFLDAIGVSGRDFADRTDFNPDDGNIRKIGKYRHTGDFIIAGQLKDGRNQDDEPIKEIGWMGPVSDVDTEEPDEDEDDGEVFDDDDYDEEIGDEQDEDEYEEDDEEDYDDDEEEYEEEEPPPPPKRRTATTKRGKR